MQAELIPATPEMAPAGSTLIHLTMGKVADYLFGDGSPAKADYVLGRLFRARRNYFSYEISTVAAVSGDVRGLLIGLAVPFMNSLELATAYRLCRTLGILGYLGFLARARPLSTVKEAEEDEYFIAHVAVLPAFQGMGLGTRMLSHAEHAAREAGYRKASMTVDVENQRALGLYLRTGFKVVETISVPTLQKRIGFEGIHRLRKVLT
jgi:ribosomal protein S18 acetylase RimI-like enzyme